MADESDERRDHSLPAPLAVAQAETVVEIREHGPGYALFVDGQHSGVVWRDRDARGKPLEWTDGIDRAGTQAALIAKVRERRERRRRQAARRAALLASRAHECHHDTQVN